MRVSTHTHTRMHVISGPSPHLHLTLMSNETKQVRVESPAQPLAAVRLKEAAGNPSLKSQQDPVGLQASTATQHEGGTRMGGRAGICPPAAPTLVSTGSREELSLGPPPAETGLPVSPPPLPLLESQGRGSIHPQGGSVKPKSAPCFAGN